MTEADIESIYLLSIAAILGAVIGVEREIAGKPAGIRTHIFVFAGSALMMILGQGIIDRFQEQETAQLLQADPIRVLQAIVVGISFLGAGTIIHDRDEGVQGLTTAATIYLSAGIGVAVAVDRILLAAITAISTTTIMVVVGYIEQSIKQRQKST